jgi:hypothetical protein
MATQRIRRLPKTVKTLTDLFTQDDVSDILNKLAKYKPNIKELIVITVDRETGIYTFHCNDSLLESTAVWLLESVKRDIMRDEDER